MKINIFKTNTISFIHKTNSIQLNYYVGDLLILQTDCVKDLGVMFKQQTAFTLSC
jgi:hypothetical protein